MSEGEMELDEIRPPAHTLYSQYLEAGQHQDLVRALWGSVPANLIEAHKLAANKRVSYGNSAQAIEELKKGMERQHREWGLLTEGVQRSIERLEMGVVETGQQPMCLGGPSLILNKIACSQRLSSSDHEEPFVPLFYVADYDGVQGELLNIRVPSPSPRGLLISLPDDDLWESPVYQLKTPSEDWLKKSVDKVLSNYRGLLGDAEPNLRERKIENLEHALTILKMAFHSSENVSEWSTKTIGTLVDVEGELGVPILSFSSPYTRPLFLRGYELLLSEPNRGRFIAASNRAVELIEGAGYRAQIGSRTDDYVPFFLECLNERCHRRRIELKYGAQEGSSSARITGKCPSCGEDYEFSFDAERPDLSEIANWISPRVDSRQIIVDSVIPVVCHVGGPGEASYYAEVTPAATSIGVPFPAFMRYTRVFYNTPWNERQSDRLREEGCPTLTDEDMFSALNRWTSARNAGDGAKIAYAHSDMRKKVESTRDRLLERMNALNKEIGEIKGHLHEPQGRPALLKELREKQWLYNAVDAYLSSAFGRFSPEHFGQEVSWSWLDLATVSGVKDLMGVFMRQYNDHTPNASTFFVNL